MAFKVRISRVKPKGNLHIVGDPRAESAKAIIESFEINADLVREQFDNPADMAGYFVIGWDWSGAKSFAWRCDSQGLIGLSIMPSWIRDILLIDIAAKEAAERITED